MLLSFNDFVLYFMFTQIAKSMPATT